jgi:hypothetical protein
MLRRRMHLLRLLAATAALIAALLAPAAHAGPGHSDGRPAGGEVAIFYYPWYGTPARDGAYLHWGQNGHVPPASLASAYMPARGPYSSADPAVTAGHLDEIAGAGIDTVVVSWWGHGSREDGLLAPLVRAAGARGMRVAVHVEPYGGRTPESVAADVERLRGLGIVDFYVYDSTLLADAQWAAVNDRLAGVRLFAHTAFPGKAAAGRFDGLYTYDVLVYDGLSFPRMCTSARALGLLCAPSVGPGFDSRRATGEQRVRSRQDGSTYDRMWRQAIRAAADVVTVTSYNEWHEGTQIEPCRAAPGYESYAGAWGLRGTAAQRAYLDRTARWVERYAERLARRTP